MASIVDKIMDRYTTAKKRGQKDLRLSIDETDDLVRYLVKVQDTNIKLSEQIISLQQELLEAKNSSTNSSETITIEADGGSW